jgi:hypothetical protein
LGTAGPTERIENWLLAAGNIATPLGIDGPASRCGVLAGAAGNIDTPLAMEGPALRGVLAGAAGNIGTPLAIEGPALRVGKRVAGTGKLATPFGTKAPTGTAIAVGSLFEVTPANEAGGESAGRTSAND